MRLMMSISSIAGVLLLAATSWASGARLVGPDSGEVEFYADAEGNELSQTVDGSTLTFPIAIEEQTGMTAKISYQGRSYWVVKAMVEIEGADAELRTESVDTGGAAASRGLGR